MLKLDRYIKIDGETIRASNLTGRFEAVDLHRIGEYVWNGYDKDQASRAGWLRRTEAGMNLAMQIVKDKSFPWPNASNVAFPLVTIAALQFHSRAYPAIIQGSEVVKFRTVGTSPSEEDCERAYRVGTFMSYQVLEQDQGWEEGHDRLLINVPIVGCAFVKTRFSNEKGHNCSDLVLAKDLVIDYFAKSVETARRKTHLLKKFRNDIYYGVKTGAYRDVLSEGWYLEDSQLTQDASKGSDDRAGVDQPVADHETPFLFLEQHCWMDLDNDGYAEPYIALVEEKSRCLVRLTLNCDREEDVSRLKDGTIVEIKGTEAFTKYGLIPSPDGGIYDMGFGVLLGPLNESTNTLINQLIDTGTMVNTAGGFLGRGAKIRGGVYTFSPLEWKRVDSTGDDLRKNVFPLPVREPSTVLFQLLGLLIDYTNRISGATEMLAGQNPGQNTAATTSDHMVEQGMKVYAAIFKRIWRSMKHEFKKLYVLNAVNLSASGIDFPGGSASRDDFLADPNRICPAADPNIVSDTIRFGQARMVAERAGMVPGYDREKVEKNLLRAAQIDGYESFFPGVAVTGQPEDIKIQVEKLRIQQKQMELQAKAMQFSIEMMEAHDLNAAKISQLSAQATDLLSQAANEETNHQIAAINAQIGAEKLHNDRIKNMVEAMLASTKMAHEGELMDQKVALEKTKLAIAKAKPKVAA